MTTDKIQEMIKFLKDANALIKDERVHDAYEKVIASVILGVEQMGDSEEKQAWLNYVLTDQAYRIGFYLWRHNLMTEELEKTVRSFELPENTIEVARKFAESDHNEDVELSKKHLEIEARRNDIQVFQSILAGDDLKTAKQRMEDFKQQQQNALEQLNSGSQAAPVRQ